MWHYLENQLIEHYSIITSLNIDSVSESLNRDVTKIKSWSIFKDMKLNPSTIKSQ